MIQSKRMEQLPRITSNQNNQLHSDDKVGNENLKMSEKEDKEIAQFASDTLTVSQRFEWSINVILTLCKTGNGKGTTINSLIGNKSIAESEDKMTIANK